MSTPNLTASGHDHPAPLKAGGLGDLARVGRGTGNVARDITPMLFLTMILLPALVVLVLAIADPGSPAPTERTGGAALSVDPG